MPDASSVTADIDTNLLLPDSAIAPAGIIVPATPVKTGGIVKVEFDSGIRAPPRKPHTASKKVPSDKLGFIWLAMFALFCATPIRDFTSDAMNFPAGPVSDTSRFAPNTSLYSCCTSANTALSSGTMVPELVR